MANAFDDKMFFQPQASANGAPIASIMEIEEVQQTIVKEDGVSETEVSHHRVFLLGENRWEEPSRLSTSKKPAETTNGSSTTVKCLTCRGEGRLLCMGISSVPSHVFAPFSTTYRRA